MSPSNKSIKHSKDHFIRFLYEMSIYLYFQGWYSQIYYIVEKCSTFEEVEEYLCQHCYSRDKSKKILLEIKLRTKNSYKNKHAKNNLKRWIKVIQQRKKLENISSVFDKKNNRKS